MSDPNVIAWLIPSHGNPAACEAVRSRSNKSRAVKSLENSASFYAAASAKDLPVSALSPGPALCLGFGTAPKGKDGFVLGTDPETCDIVLPSLPGISRRHCCLSFDSEARLVLQDFSRNGTAVWYDHHSNGDRRNFSWLLSGGGSYGFPDMVRRIVIDIQTIRFQVLVNDHASDLDLYQANVDKFLGRVAWTHQPLQQSVTASFPVPDARPIYLKLSKHSESGLIDETFVWNPSKPWEPIVRVTE